MLKRKSGRPKLVSIKIPEDVVVLARMVSVYTGKTMADLIADAARPVLEKQERKGAAKWPPVRGKAKAAAKKKTMGTE